jgi:hypothetical protein
MLAALALGAAALWALLAGARPLRPNTERRRLAVAQTWPLAALIIVPLLLGYVAQRVLSFMDPRFFFYVTPVLAVLAAVGLVRLRRVAIPVGLALAVAWVVALPTAYAPYGTPQDDLRPIAETVRRYVRPDDSVVVAYIWQEGMLRMYAPEVRPTYTLGWYSPEEAGPALTAQLLDHPRVWLVSFDVPLQDPANTAGWWLEQHAARAYQQTEGNNHLASYVRCPAPPGAVATARLSDANNASIALAYTPLEADLSRGQTLCVPLSWQSVASGQDDVAQLAGCSVFVHLADAQGRPWAQSDSAPRQGLRGFDSLARGETVFDPRALLITTDIPPGDYRVLVGVYRPGDGQRLRVAQGPQVGADSVQVGTVVVKEQ